LLIVAAVSTIDYFRLIDAAVSTINCFWLIQSLIFICFIIIIREGFATLIFAVIIIVANLLRLTIIWVNVVR